MLGIGIETLMTIGTIVLISIVQIILSLKGKTDTAIKLEQKKAKLLQKYTEQRDQTIIKGQKIQEKINELKGDSENVKTRN